MEILQTIFFSNLTKIQSARKSCTPDNLKSIKCLVSEKRKKQRDPCGQKDANFNAFCTLRTSLYNCLLFNPRPTSPHSKRCMGLMGHLE